MKLFPENQDTHESILIGPIDLSQRGVTRELPVLCRITSDRRDAEVTIVIGDTKLVVSGDNARSLSEALSEHVDHLGPLCRMMVRERIENERQ